MDLLDWSGFAGLDLLENDGLVVPPARNKLENGELRGSVTVVSRELFRNLPLALCVS
jgi:hypothetical protein